MPSTFVAFPGMTYGVDLHNDYVFEATVLGPLSGVPAMLAPPSGFPTSQLTFSYPTGASMILLGSFSVSGLGVNPASTVTGLQIFHPGGSAPAMTVSGTAAVTLQQILDSDGDTFELFEAQGLDITGTDYADTLEGGIGPDILRGGAGDDSYYITNVEDFAVDSSGIDVAYVMSPWTMSDGIENLVLVEGTIYAVGNELANTMTGNTASNALAGMGGDDTLFGLFGNDYLLGGAGADSLIGGDGADTLQGDAGADVLLGGPGHDTYIVTQEDIVMLPSSSIYMTGMGYILNGTRSLVITPQNTRVYLFDDSQDGAVDTLSLLYADPQPYGPNWDFLFSTRLTDRPLEVGTFENAVLSPFVPGPHPEISVGGEGRGGTYIGTFRIDDIAVGVGNTLDRLQLSFLYGTDGFTEVQGSISINSVGQNTFADTIIENPGEGTDTVSTNASFTLPDGLENLALTGSGITGAGNALGNFIQDNAASNSLRGMGGADNISGGGGDDWIEGDSGNSPLPLGQTAGDDIISGGDGNDTVLGGAGVDQIHGDAGNDLIVGESGGDVIYGDDGDDLINGDSGGDVIYGGNGRDIVFGSFDGDSIFGGAGDDILMGEGGLGDDAIGSLDVVYGEEGNDLVAGYGGDDWLFGGPGADVMDGGFGSDMMVAGLGADIMLGSGASAYGAAKPGSDLFVYTSMADAGDQIWGFDTRLGNTDGIDLRPLFDALGYTDTNPRAAGFMTVTTGPTPSDAVVFIDANGGGDSYAPLLTLYGVSPATLTDAFFLFQ